MISGSRRPALRRSVPRPIVKGRPGPRARPRPLWLLWGRFLGLLVRRRDGLGEPGLAIDDVGRDPAEGSPAQPDPGVDRQLEIRCAGIMEDSVLHGSRLRWSCGLGRDVTPRRSGRGSK